MTTRPNAPIVERLHTAPKNVHVATHHVSDLAAVLGTPAFIQGLLAFAGHYVKPSFVSVMCLGDDGAPFLVGTESTVGKARAKLAAKGYGTHFLADANYGLMQSRNALGDFSTYQARRDIDAFLYRRDCYDRPGIADRRSVLRKRENFALSLSFYRSIEAGEFGDEDRVKLDGLLPMLLTMTERHVAFELKGQIAKAQDNEARLAISYPSLTARERQVASMSIKGMTAEAISRVLRISKTTVITHRKNAYRRMGVKNLRELLRL